VSDDESTRADRANGDDGAIPTESPVERPRRRGPRSRRRSAVAWGAVGALTFLVCHQGYVLLGGEGVGLPLALVVAAAVFAVATPLSYLAEGALTSRNERA
jgi:hypothetical protein